MPASLLNKRNADTVVVLDFETTGLSPNTGDRAIEIGAVLVEDGRITDRFQKLMNPGLETVFRRSLPDLSKGTIL